MSFLSPVRLRAATHRAGLASSLSASSVRALALRRASSQPYRSHLPTAGVASPAIHSFFHEPTSTFSFVAVDPKSLEAVIIDPVLDFDPAASRIGTESITGIVEWATAQGLKITRSIETHAHADHLTAAQVLKRLISPDLPVCIGHRIKLVQDHFAPVYDIPKEDTERAFDHLFEDGETFQVGTLEARVLHLPGHTPDSIGLHIGDAVFAGDSIFLPDVGSARSDFPGGDAEALYDSMQKLLSLPSETRIFSGHDYPSSRPQSCVATVSAQQSSNKHVGAGIKLEEFAAMRRERDASLGVPKLLHASLQVNLRGGRLGRSDDMGRRWIKLPLSGDLDF